MTLRRSRSLAACGLLLLLTNFSTAWLNERPVLEVRDGNLFIISAKDRNITLQSLGSSIVNVNGINLLQVATSAQDASQLVERWRLGMLTDMQSTLRRLTESIEGPSGLQSRVNAIESGVDLNRSGSTQGGHTTPRNDAYPGLRIRRLTARVRQVELQLASLRRKLETDECVSNPCQNGGTCEDIVDGYKCRCLEGWEGPQCNVDINECNRYAGTDLGCQNGAVCRNLPGTYQCDCRNGFNGIHCAKQSMDCSYENSDELCGHGYCINKPGSVLGYTCICKQGWEAEGSNPACIKDVNECAGNHPPCSVNPMVPCNNAPGTYHCGGCPQGYTGNGYYCADIDECAINNGGCSTTPFVQCINSMGSSMCGSCPPAYRGDGVTCSYVGPCATNNGGCHPWATCVSLPGMGDLRVQCRCPPGYEGTGMGSNGCIVTTIISGSLACSSNPCNHGACSSRGAYDYTCGCEPGYTGKNCNVEVNPCDPNPCQNHGTCSISNTRAAVCRCTADFSGPHCETARQSCGGRLTDPSGILQFPSDGDTYRHGLSCAWLLNTNSSSVLNVTFTAFNVEQSTDCQYDFVQVHDGRTASDHMIGRFCGTSLPAGGNIISTHDSLYLWFYSDNSVARDGFTLQWNSVAPLCGGEINADYGRISSPGSPGRYPLNRDCYWHVSVTAGKQIQFNFFDVSLEEHPTCQNDYLEIRDGPNESSQQLGIFCNHTLPPPPPLVTPGSEAWVHFHSDSSGQDAGFQIAFSSKGAEGCWGVYTAASGQITSPDFGTDYYKPNMECEWKIQVPTGERIHITWQDFELERARTCRYDFVEVYDGSDREAPTFGKYCGRTFPPSILSNSNALLIRFRTDASYGRRGFKLNYEVRCGGESTKSTGVIKSPYYPNNYPASRTCIYEIIQPVGKAIKLTIQDIDIERSYLSGCRYDYLEIRDGDNENSTKIGTYCGGNSSIPEFPIMSTHNYLWLKFRTDSSVHYRGFMATYETVDRRCGGLLKAQTGIIQTPSEGGRYGNGEDCTWIIQAPPGHIVQLSWLTFSLEYQASCRHDYIQISENLTSTSEQDMGKYCGSTKPPILTTQSPIMTIKFHTDGSVTREGFAASYVLLDASKVCGGHFHSVTGTMMSPNYPQNYPANRVCEWIIQAENNHQVTLNVKKFNIEDHDRCDYDYLEIRNGGSESSPLMGKYCGTDLSTPITSFGNQLYVKFNSDSSRGREGFNIEWDSTIIGCGGSLTTTSGSISSPNYPQPYSRSAECNWKIKVSAGSIIQFIIGDLELEADGRCDYDFIEIYEGPDNRRKKVGRYCESHRPLYIQTTSNLASVRFRSDYSNSGRGFQMNYHSLCHRNVSGFRGVIESPNFPNQYPNRENCSWTISAPKGNKLNLTFSHFDLEAGEKDSCSYDYLDIKEGENDTPNRHIGKYCDSTELPPKVVSTQNQVFLEFYSDMYLVNNGFRLEWVVNGCGGFLNRPQGTITSPGYPNQYPQNIVCEWTIEVDYSHSIEIIFERVDLEDSSNCHYDKVGVYSGNDATAPRLTEMCHTNVPQILTSTGNKMFVKFEADIGHQGTGFLATYKTVSVQCGGRFTVPTGVIHSTGYPLNYPAQQNCAWLIQVPVNHLVNLTFIDFDIAASNNCTSDYVRIYDGSSQDASVLGSHCQNTLPPSYVSTSNEMLVVMRTDSPQPAKGFRATYTLACGARIVTNDQGILSMDSAVGLQTEMENCTWTIIAQDPGDHVTLTLREMRVLSVYDGDNGCESRSIQIFEGERINGPLLGTWCSTKVPPPITSQGNALTVHATSLYGSLYKTQFTGTYSVLNSACGGDYTSEHGTIATPGYPNSYPRNVECVWQIQLSPGSRLSLSFTEFDVFESEHCDLDYVEVREESGMGRLIGVYCGKNVDAVTSSKSLWIKFESSADETKKGFVAEYSMLHGGELSGPSGEIASPLYPKPCSLRGEYTWRITVDDPASSIKITFEDFHIEQFGKDCYIDLTIYDGYDENAPELMSKCGVILPEAVRSLSNMVYIKFNSVPLREGSWFLLNWLQVPRESGGSTNIISKVECAEIISLTGPDNSTYQFNSPGWPSGYQNNLDCSWTFESVPGTHLVLTFLTFNLDESEGCIADHVDVFSGNSLTSQTDWSQIGTFCLRNATERYIESSDLMKVQFVSDVYANKTGFKALVTKVCGGQLYGPNGVIEINRTSSTENVWSANCQWNVTVRPGRTIEVKLMNIAIGGTSDPRCSDNYLMLKNGGSASSPVLGLGKYCGNTVPGTLQTTGNQLYVKVSGTKRTTRFALRYREVGMDCGGEIVLSKSTKTWELNSPNYPNIPSPHSECFWTIMAPAGEPIMIEFIDRFDLSHSDGCTLEYIEVRDGGTDSSKLLGRFCGNRPDSITTIGNFMYLHFETDITEPGNGFKARVSIGDQCGGTISLQRGVLQSLNYPDAYPSNVNCTWNIIGPERHYMKLQFQELDLPRGRNCENIDHVVISELVRYNDTEDDVPRQIGQYCGSNKPGVIEPSGNEIQVTFNSDNRDPFRYKGFNMNFSTSMETCGGILEASAGEFSSPGYPNRKTHLRHCQWRIKVPVGYRIQVDLLDFDIGVGIPNDRWWPFSRPQLTFYNSLHRGTPFKRMRGADTSRQVLSTSNTMMILYGTNSNSNRGFKARYISIPALCGGAITNVQGTLVSNQESLFNMTNFYCAWTVNSPWNDTTSQTLAISVSGFIGLDRDSPFIIPNRSPRRNNFCGYLSPRISVGDSKDIFSQVCGNVSSGVVVRSPSPINTITALKNSPEWLIRGPVNFTLNYHWHQCGGLLSGPSHTISAPRNLTYPIDCAWHAKFSSNGETILLTVDKMNLGSCTRNYIIVRNGGAMSPQVQKYCGSISTNITSQSNQLWIEYHAEDSNNEFEIQLNTIQGGCGGMLQSSGEIFSSPGYPKQYPNNTECTWYISVESGYHIGLVFVDRFNLETSDNCENDFVQISYPQENATTGSLEYFKEPKLCGRNLPPFINSTSNGMQVLFRSNSRIQGDGFRAKWNANCGGILPVSRQTKILTSPGWPRYYPRNLQCNYTFLAPGKHMIVKFIEFNLEDSTMENCRYAKVTITTSRNRGVPSVWCGRNSPPIQRAESRLELQLTSDLYVARKGFKLTYYLDECGGEITGPADIGSPSIDDSGSYYERINCTWVVRAPAGKAAVIRFESFHLEYNKLCQYDYVNIYSGLIIKYEHKLASLCGSLNGTLPVVKSENGSMIINFVTDQSFNYGGFKAKISFTSGEASGCGGTIQLSDTQTFRTQRGLTYESLEDCHWLIQAPTDNVVRLRISSLDLKNATSATGDNQTNACTGDYLEIHDGAGPFSELIGQYCGNITPPPITSSYNKMWIRLVTDGTLNGHGVTASLESLPPPCGNSTLTVGNHTEVLASPGFPKMFEAGLRCRWKVAFSNAAKRWKSLTIHFIKFDMADSENCNEDRLSIAGSNIEDFVSEGFGRDFVFSGTPTRPRYLWRGRRVPQETFMYCGNVRPIDYHRGLLLKFREKPEEPGYQVARPLSDPPHILSFQRQPLANDFHYRSTRISLAFSYRTFHIHSGLWDAILIDSLFHLLQLAKKGFPDQPTFMKSTNGNGGEVVLSFKSSQTPKATNHTGFKLEFSASSCNRNFTSPQGRILHEDISDCWFTITAPMGSTISLYFNEFSLYSRQGCTKSALQVHDGDFNNSSLALSCGMRLPNPIFSSGNKLSLHSWVQEPSDYDRYDITYTTTDKGRGCGGKLYNYKGRFTSPLYPGPYRNVSECTWEVSVPAGFIVKLHFIFFDIGSANTCESDNLQISDVPSEGPALASSTYCGGDRPAPYVSTQGKVSIKYSTSMNNGGTGWIIDFTAQRHDQRSSAASELGLIYPEPIMLV